MSNLDPIYNAGYREGKKAEAADHGQTKARKLYWQGVAGTLQQGIELAYEELGHICHADAEHNPHANAAHSLLGNLLRYFDPMDAEWAEAKKRLADEGIDVGDVKKIIESLAEEAS